MIAAEVNNARYQIFCAKYDSPNERKVNIQTTMFPPERNGWNLNQDESGDNYLTLNWFDGEMLPKKLEDVQQNESPNEGEGEYEEIEEMDNESEEEETVAEEAAEDEDSAADD
ncbi:hypothetical protein OUZ56_016803 [Daphnia magna]|uniref:Uncharacterized protein n=1 Tax=Daphnia magna TaxID=35525 RepID=A0ABR0ARL8_9CRUS|nr:hypothetical protein OUZ56_016803 [Daphnia magna]